MSNKFDDLEATFLSKFDDDVDRIFIATLLTHVKGQAITRNNVAKLLGASDNYFSPTIDVHNLRRPAFHAIEALVLHQSGHNVNMTKLQQQVTSRDKTIADLRAKLADAEQLRGLHAANNGALHNMVSDRVAEEMQRRESVKKQQAEWARRQHINLVPDPDPDLEEDSND